MPLSNAGTFFRMFFLILRVKNSIVRMNVNNNIVVSLREKESLLVCTEGGLVTGVNKMLW